MRDHSNNVMLTPLQAVEVMLAHCAFSPQAEDVPITQAYNRVLSADVLSKIDVPGTLTCLMDSVAVHWADFAQGLPDTSAWERGVQWEFANTGIAMPAGFDTAVVVENVVFSGGDRRVEFLAAPSRQYAGTRPAGSTYAKNDLILQAGTVVTPQLAALIAMTGNSSVQVVRRPRVGFIPTGNELVQVESDIPPNRTVESNGVIIRGKIIEWGGEPVIYGICPDEPALIERALRRAISECDIVVVNAGSSKGSDDWCIEVMERLGQVFYHETSHGPGHHSSGALIEGTPIVGISGPPLGAGFTTDFYLKPLMQRFYEQRTEPILLRARLERAFPVKKHDHGGKPVGEKRPNLAHPDEEFYTIMHVYLSQDEEGVLVATPTQHSRPDLVEANAADGYYFNPSWPGAPQASAGDIIEVYLKAPRL